jgi:hypothetical protein
MSAAGALLENSRRILAGIHEQAENALQPLLEEREDRIQAFREAVARGERVEPEDVREIRRLESQVASALTQQREAALEELRAIRAARSAGAAYHPEPQRHARFLDRNG